MSKSQQQKTIQNFIWGFLETYSKQFIIVITGIILARILGPYEFGLIGMIAVFLSLSQVFMNSGFSQALIRKKECTQEEYSVVFISNFMLSIIAYGVLYFSAFRIAEFFKQPELIDIIKIMGLGIPFLAFEIIQKTILTRNLEFKIQTKISVISNSLSGITAIVMAVAGFGVWALVVRFVMNSFISAVLYWVYVSWRPSFTFNFTVFWELFSFSWKLLLSGLISTIYNNVYYIIIGKFFHTAEVGFFNRADQFKNLVSKNFTSVIQRVSLPTLSRYQDDKDLYKNKFKKLFISTLILSSSIQFFLASVSHNLIIILLGEKWEVAGVYLQYLLYASIFYPLSALNLNTLIVYKRSDLFLFLEIIKRIFVIPIIFLGIVYGIKIMLVAMIFFSVIFYFINSIYAGNLMNYNIFEQLKDMVGYLVATGIIGGAIYTINYIPIKSIYILFSVQLITGIFLYLGFFEKIKFEEYLAIKRMLYHKLRLR
jgi:O-antigen/teichoic acid export membrane protein